jgi:hypothetical protein
MDKIKAMLPLRQVIPVLVVYVILTAVGLHFHEVGLEEGQQYLFGRDSVSAADLYHNMRYEGHPRLWCFLLYQIIHHLTADFAAIQAFHLLITTCSVYLFLRYAPFGLLMKIAIVFGYYFIFEYNLQSRSYGLGILLLFISCLLLSNPSKYLIAIGCLLFLLCNTDIFYAFAAGGIFLSLLADALRRRLPVLPFAVMTALLLAGMGCALIQAQVPRGDFILHISPGAWLSQKNLMAGMVALPDGWLPIPADRIHFWNTFLINSHHLTFVRILLFLLLLAFPAIALKGNRKALVFYYTSLLLLLALLVVTTLSAARYFGMVYIYFLAACWMAGEGLAVRLPGAAPGLGAVGLLRIAFGVMIAVQLVVGGFALTQDLIRPFSQAKNAIAWLKDCGLDQQPIVVGEYIAGPALSTYLGKKVWYLNTGDLGSFCLWRTPYLPQPPRTIGEEMTSAAFLQKLDKFVLLSAAQLDPRLVREGTGDFRLSPLKSFPNGILPMEDCYIYQATREQITKSQE